MAAPWIVDDGVWELIAPLLPPWPTRSPGPRPVDDRRCLQGILFVLYTGIGGEELPQELGFGSGMTCWRRLRHWTDAGVFDQLPRVLLARLHAAGVIDCSRAVADAAHLRAKKGAPGSGRPQGPGKVVRQRSEIGGVARYVGAGGSCTGVAASLAGMHTLRGDRSILLEATLPGPWGRPRSTGAALVASTI